MMDESSKLLLTVAIPTVDTWTFTISGQPWFDQQWGAQVALRAIFDLGSWTGLALLRAVLVGLIFGCVFAVARRGGLGLREGRGGGAAGAVRRDERATVAHGEHQPQDGDPDQQREGSGDACARRIQIDPRKHEQEFFAAPAHEDVVGPHRASQQRAHVAENLVEGRAHGQCAGFTK